MRKTSPTGRWIWPPLDIRSKWKERSRKQVWGQLLGKAGYKVGDPVHRLADWRDASVWKRASLNTLNCLIGCSIGDFGTLIMFQYFAPTTNLWLVSLLAMVNGLITSLMLESIMLRYKESFPWRSAVRTAFGMSFLSMLAMEAAMNATDLMMTGGGVSLRDPFYWMAMTLSLVAGFLVPLPYNYHKLKKHRISCH